jgi:hypothetical protein
LVHKIFIFFLKSKCQHKGWHHVKVRMAPHHHLCPEAVAVVMVLHLPELLRLAAVERRRQTPY